MTTTTSRPVFEKDSAGNWTVGREDYQTAATSFIGTGMTKEEALLNLCLNEGQSRLQASHEIAAYQAEQRAAAKAQPSLPELASSDEHIAARKGKAHTKYYTKDGQQVPGVTTVLGVINKPFLIKWANNLGLQGIDSTKYVDALANIGTIAHYLIECDIAGTVPYTDDYSPNDLKAAMRSFDSWRAWRRDKEIIPIFSERAMVSNVHGYGGTVDHYVLIDGIPTLLDIKTAKAIYSEQLVQVVAYREAMLENGHIVDDCRIIRVGREEGEGFEDKSVDLLEQRFDLFSHALAIYNLQKTLRW